MTVDVITEIDIECPLEEVSHFAADPDNVRKWYKNINSVEWITDRPLTLGTRVAFVARFLGRKLSYTYEVVDFVPHEHMTMRTAEGPFPMETTYTWSGDDKVTHMTLRNKGQPAGFSRLLAPFMSVAIKKATQKDLARLKQLLEQSG